MSIYSNNSYKVQVIRSETATTKVFQCKKLHRELAGRSLFNKSYVTWLHWKRCNFYKWVTVLQLKHEANVVERLLEAGTEIWKENSVWADGLGQKVLKTLWVTLDLALIQYRLWMETMTLLQVNYIDCSPSFFQAGGIYYYLVTWLLGWSTHHYSNSNH